MVLLSAGRGGDSFPIPFREQEWKSPWRYSQIAGFSGSLKLAGSFHGACLANKSKMRPAFSLRVTTTKSRDGIIPNHQAVCMSLCTFKSHLSQEERVTDPKQAIDTNKKEKRTQGFGRVNFRFKKIKVKYL
ncbi:uncharacterized protein RHO17_022861 isoform 1-T2 [Thomomys bottae]